MESVDRRSLILLVLGGASQGGISDGIGGITRLQKLVFLLEQEEGVSPSQDGFEFSAYKAGPYSSKLYDDLEFLENLGLIESEITAEATEPEAAELDLLSFDELIGESADNSSGKPQDGFADSYEARKFRLTQQGRKKIEGLIAAQKYRPLIEKIEKVKTRYGRYSLSDLLYHVYKKYPNMTTESEIKDHVLQRHRRP